MKLRLYALALLAPVNALAAPTYLKCEMPAESGPFLFNVTLDEGAGSADLFFPHSGYRQRLIATFTANEVRFGDRQIQYTVNRTDLSVVRVTPIIKSIEQGVCKVEAAPKRAF